MLRIVSILRSGGIYTPAWVKRLHAGVLSFASEKIEHVCLTDMEFDHPQIICRELRTGWPGWWAKLEQWLPENLDHTGPYLYLDLDNVIARDVYLLMAHWKNGLICMAEPTKDKPNSSVMLYSGEWATSIGVSMVTRFAKAPVSEMERCQNGDQQYIDENTRTYLFPRDLVSSYKGHVMHAGLPLKSAVVQFHGEPKPHQLDVNDPWRKLWEGSTS